MAAASLPSVLPAQQAVQISSKPNSEGSNVVARVALMQASQLFVHMTQEDCVRIAAYARGKSFARGEYLLMQGQPLRSLFLLRSGSIKVTQLSPSGNEVILWMYGVGSVVGVLTEPTSCCYTSSAKAMEQSTALFWEYATLQKLMVEFPQVRRNISQILVERLNELEERFREVATENVARRLSLALLRLLKHIGKDVKGGVEVSLSREELAQMTGTTLFTISRILSKWGREDLIVPRRESVLVRDPGKLEILSESI
jgi:CRP-like cAMP-binding protein